MQRQIIVVQWQQVIHHVAYYQLFLDDIITLQADINSKVSSQVQFTGVGIYNYYLMCCPNNNCHVLCQLGCVDWTWYSSVTGTFTLCILLNEQYQAKLY